MCIIGNKQCGQCGHLNKKWNKGIQGFFAKLMNPHVISDKYCELKIDSTWFDVQRIVPVPFNPKKRSEFFKEARQLCGFFTVDWNETR